MIETDDIKLDANGVPVLDTPIDPARLADTPGAAAPSQATVDLTDQEQIDSLLETPEAQQMLQDLAEDLQQSITVRIETLMKEEITRLVHQATEQHAAKIAEDIHTHLQLAIPELLAEIARQSKS